MRWYFMSTWALPTYFPLCVFVFCFGAVASMWRLQVNRAMGFVFFSILAFWAEWGLELFSLAGGFGCEEEREEREGVCVCVGSWFFAQKTKVHCVVC